MKEAARDAEWTAWRPPDHPAVETTLGLTADSPTAP